MTIDKYIGNPEAFPILRHWDFFNHAAVCPLPHVTAEVLRSFATQAEDASYVDSGWYPQVEALRDSTAKLIHCDRDEVALVKNTSEGLSTVAQGIDWRPGDRIVTTAFEYPANMYPWMDLARRKHIEFATVIPQTEAILAALDHPKTRMLSLSHVQFASGQRHDLVTIGQFCRQRGILFCIDAIQSLGVLPVDVRQMQIDFLSADGHKWLLGPEGAGIFYCRRELAAQVHPPMIGWLNVTKSSDYDHYDFTLRPDARRFECGTHNVPGFLMLKASIDLLLEVGIQAISARIKALTDQLVEGLQHSGCKIASPRDHEQWSGIVSFDCPSGRNQELVASLRKDHRVELVVRGGRVRASPHFYNTEAQIERLIELVKASS
jgi:selenocysteine lyase/cysteine desulfurase